MRTLNYNREHKNGWYSWKIPGVTGALFIDGRMLTDEGKANLPQVLSVEFDGFQEAGADQSEAARLKAEKKMEREAAKAAKVAASAAKAQARLDKLQAAAAKAQARAEAVLAKAQAASAPADAPVA